MPCGVICIPDGHFDKCKPDIAALQKKVKGEMRLAVAHKALDAMEKGNELAAADPTKKCNLFIIHSKFFNITKDPFAATLFKSMQKNNTAAFACGKHGACDKPGKKFHWYMGEDAEWDIPAAVKNIEKLLKGEFTESGYKGRPLKPKSSPGAAEVPAGNMMMGGTMGTAGGIAIGGMGGMAMSGMMGSGMMGSGGMGTMGGMMGTNMGNMSGNMGGNMADPNGMSASMPRMGSMSGGLGGMSGNLGDLGANNMTGSVGSLSAPLQMATPPGKFGGGMGTMGTGTMMDAAKAPPPDILVETENMLNQGMPLTEVVKMLANEVQRLSNLVQPCS